MNLFNFFKNQKNQEKGKWILKGMFVSLILGLTLIPVFSLATNKAPIPLPTPKSKKQKYDKRKIITRN